MLVFSGLGAALSGPLTAWPRVVVTVSCLVVLAWTAAMLRWSEPAMLQTLDWPWGGRVGAALLVMAPVSLALGVAFPLGLTRIGTGSYLPWAWGLNGAFSVVATPLANLMARELGLSRLLIGAGALYLLVLLASVLAGGARKPEALPA